MDQVSRDCAGVSDAYECVDGAFAGAERYS